MYLFELRHKFAQHIFYIDHLLNEESGGLRGGGERFKESSRVVSAFLRFGFSPISPTSHLTLALDLLSPSFYTHAFSEVSLSSDRIRYVTSAGGSLSFKSPSVAA